MLSPRKYLGLYYCLASNNARTSATPETTNVRNINPPTTSILMFFSPISAIVTYKQLTNLGQSSCRHRFVRIFLSPNAAEFFTLTKTSHSEYPNPKTKFADTKYDTI